ncbi:MAG: polysaccharide deacetylase family protein [Lachnospiraceae bacterium]|nr:polysaccharide deacetylase family protein [Lachnospiraceae bacterium]
MQQVRAGREGQSLAAEAETAGDKLVALTFDDGPHEGSTERLLEGLREREVRATFFLIGGSIEGKEALVEQMAQDGHLIGSHTFHHVQLTGLSLEKACEEITMTNEAITGVTGQTVEYIRPPYGSWNSKLECAVNMREVGWTVDPRDWDVKNTDVIVKRVLGDVKDGSIILLHDVYDTSVEAAFRIIDELKAQGYTFVTVDRLLID